MPTVTLPDGSQRNFDHPVTVHEVAANIGAGLAKAALAGKVDGTLVDTDHLHLVSLNRLFAEQGFQIDRPTYTARIMGQPHSGIAEAFLPHLAPSDAAALLARKEAVYRELVGALSAIAGLIELLDWAELRGIPGFEGSLTAISPIQRDFPRQLHWWWHQHWQRWP